MLLAFWRTTFIDPTALIAGGVFMGVNFFLLSFGIAWALTPLASKGRIKVGIGFGLEDSLFFGIVDDGFFSLSLGCDFLCSGLFDIDHSHRR